MTPGNREEVAIADASTLSGRPPRIAKVWWIAALAVVALLLVHFSTMTGLVGTWMSSISYNHGFLVLPVSAWLLWHERARFADVRWQPWWPALIGLALFGALWFFGYATNIKSFRDLGLVASIPLTLIAARRAKSLPSTAISEVFIPHLVDLTADFTVVALRLSGVPVYREGNNFVIPSGEWSVVQECSGVNYLLVSLFAGSLFGYLNFRSNVRRWIFLGLALVVPIAANWLRAYGIVLLGHVTNNKLATGVDHLVYGWLFFGVVMTALFYFSTLWMGEPAPKKKPPEPLRPQPVPPRLGNVWTVGVAAIALAAIAPLAAARFDAMAQSVSDRTVSALPASLGDWGLTAEHEIGWKDPFDYATSRQKAVYRRAEGIVEAHIAWYAADSGVSKLTRFEGATMVDYDSTWRVQSKLDRRVGELSPPLRVGERQIHSRDEQILVWQWALVGGVEASGFVDSKLALARSRLSGRGSDSAGVALVAPIRDGNIAEARSRLQDFAKQLRPWIQSDLLQDEVK